MTMLPCLHPGPPISTPHSTSIPTPGPRTPEPFRSSYNRLEGIRWLEFLPWRMVTSSRPAWSEYMTRLCPDGKKRGEVGRERGRGEKRKSGGEERRGGRQKIEFLPLEALFSLPPSPVSPSLSPLSSSGPPPHPSTCRYLGRSQDHLGVPPLVLHVWFETRSVISLEPASWPD